MRRIGRKGLRCLEEEKKLNEDWRDNFHGLLADVLDENWDAVEGWQKDYADEKLLEKKRKVDEEDKEYDCEDECDCEKDKTCKTYICSRCDGPCCDVCVCRSVAPDAWGDVVCHACCTHEECPDK